MSQKTRAQMLAEIAALLPTNGSGLITAAALRTVENDMSDSVFMPLTDGTPVLGTRTVNAHPLSADVTVTKADVGLGSVNDTSDAAKPVSTAQQTALDLKLNAANPSSTGTFQNNASGKFFTVDDEGVHSDVPIICQPLTIGNADPTTLDRVTSFVYYNRADAQAIVVHEISDVADGQPLTIKNNIALPVQITAVAGNSFSNGSLGTVSSITLAAKETIMLVVFGNLWSVANRYVSISSGSGSSGGDVFGPSGAVNNNVAVFDGTTGKLIKDSGAVAIFGDIISSGSGSSGHVPLGNGSGFIDQSWLPTVGVTPGAYTNVNLTVDSRGRITIISNGSSGGGGGASDYLSALTGAEIAITNASTTLTISRQHAIKATSANQTNALPAASGNTGKFISFRITLDSTKDVTIDGNGSETIDGELTRLLRAGESAVLYCDGSNWFKIDGKTIPMVSTVRYGTGSVNQYTFASGAATGIPIDTVTYDPESLFSSGDTAIKIRRPGAYQCVFGYTAGDNLTAATYWQIGAFVNGALLNGGNAVQPISYNGGINNLVLIQYVSMLQLVAADLIQPGYYTSDIAGKKSRASDGAEPYATVIEIPSW